MTTPAHDFAAEFLDLPAEERARIPELLVASFEPKLIAPVAKRLTISLAGSTPTKVLTSIRLDADVLAFFKSQGSGYQSRINDTLRKEVNRNLTGGPRPTTRRRVAA